MRARTFWFLTLPALFVAETAGHTLWRARSTRRTRVTVCSRTSWRTSPCRSSRCVVLLAAAILGRRVLASFRAEGPQPLPSWRLAALPALGFLFQEHAEQLVHDGPVRCADSRSSRWS